MIWRGTDHVEPNPSYLAEDHTDGPDWASWTHRQLGVMMHRMLPINRMYSSAEASHADTPDRATEGGPAERPEARRLEREQLDQEEGCWSSELNGELKWKMREEREVKQFWRHHKKKLLCKKKHEKRRISFVVTFKDLWSKVKETWRIKCARRQKETVFG